MDNRMHNPHVPMRIRRAGSLGQLDSEFDHGPRPLDKREVPIDLRERIIRHDRQYGEGGPGSGYGGGLGDIAQLVNDVHSIAGVFVLRRGLIGRAQSITGTPSLIIRQAEIGGRGYLLLNPSGVTGLTAEGTMFSSTTLVGATTLLSGALGVANFKTARFFLTSTLGAGVGPVTFDLQTRDPVTGAYITSQTLFSVGGTPLNAYTDVGTNGIDVDAKVLVTVPAGTTITFTLGYVLKDGLADTSSGSSQTIFVGGAGVSPTSGFPILAGKDRAFYFMENVSLYAVTAGAQLDMNIFEL